MYHFLDKVLFLEDKTEIDQQSIVLLLLKSIYLILDSLDLA